jgi:predicted amidophosphoribosyltransferase
MKNKSNDNPNQISETLGIHGNSSKDQEKQEKNEIKSLFPYEDHEIKRIIWSLKKDEGFCNTKDGIRIIGIIKRESKNFDAIISVPSSSYWQSLKKFDHMHKILRKIPRYIPYAIVPRLHKSEQKSLNKMERINQIYKSYRLSLRFRYLIMNKTDLNILIVDDLRTTGLTLHEAYSIVKSTPHKFGDIRIKCLTIAYEA